MMKKDTLGRITRSWWFSILAAVVVATSIKSAVADWNDVPTGSMEPTILIGDRILVNKLAYDLKLPYTTVHLATWANPRRGDIVVFYSPADGKRLVKRIVGIPGDTIAMVNDQLTINGKALSYKAIGGDATHPEFTENLIGCVHDVQFLPKVLALRTFGPVTVPPHEYFAMGDNRDNSADSRFIGFIPRGDIVGRATAVVLSRKGSFLHPRWGRFFTALK